MSIQRRRRAAALLPFLTLLATLLPLSATPAAASHTGNPGSVTVVGSLQSELGCPDDWQPACATTHLTYESADEVWQGSWTVPAGSFDYKAALNNAWDENYGQNATPGGADIALAGDGSTVKFYYSHATHWIADSKTKVIATVPGSFQSAIGCAGDWQPDCLQSWLQDPDGDGTYSFTTTEIPAGAYEAKVTHNESWDVNYGQGGAKDGANYSFTIPASATVSFSYDATSHVLTISAQGSGSQSDNNIEWDGVRHESRDTLYRAPGGAVPAGTPVTLRLRTFHNDVTGVGLRLYDLNANGQRVVPMTVAASDVSCAQAGLENRTCDFWEATLPGVEPNNLWYRFIVTDGTDTDYYADNTGALDGGIGAMTDEPIDNSYALMFFQPGFSAPAWAKGAVVYQIFPDRFRNGRTDNDPRTGDVRYDDPVLALPWGTLPEGYCRNYADGDTNCPWRFDSTPPDWSPTKEGPRGRDYMGGDLKGVDQQLDYLKALGVNTLYFNPIFDAGSNHSYDTQNYKQIDPYFGTQKDWENLNKHADQLGIKIILDGVFNHMSSDSPLFDRYGHYATVGACESVSSPYRSWFVFRPEANGPCAGPDGPRTMNYEGWFGFDSIPVLNKTDAQVQSYFLTSTDSVAKQWLKAGAEGWRMDVSGDPSFPDGYWEKFRTATKGTDRNALLISETWQKDSTLLRMLRGDRLDSTMNYRLRDAVIGLLANGNFDGKGFADSGRIISPSEFTARLAAIREDYPDAAFFSLMNLLDSHDTERLLWTLTPGAETRAEREFNAANVAAGKQRVRLASLIQFMVPGMPTVYYGDEVGVTGDDDPDDRRTYPWLDKGGQPDMALYQHYQKLAQLRAANGALVSGDLQMFPGDDAAGTVAFGRKTESQAAIVALNRSGAARTIEIPVAGYLPDGTTLSTLYSVGTSGTTQATVSGGKLQVSVGALSGVVLATGTVDLKPTAAPSNLRVTEEGSTRVGLAWNGVSGAAGYNVYRSVVSGGGYLKLNTTPVAGTSYVDSDAALRNATRYFYVVKALDAAGNESAASNQAVALPHLTIGWANLQWPPSMSHTVSAVDRTDEVYGQVWIDGASNQPGATPSLRAQLGYGPDGSNPDGNAAWSWIDATFNTDAGNNDEFKASLQPEAAGQYDYAYRYSTTAGRDWVYADLDGIGNGYSPTQAGALTVNASADTTAPSVPGSLRVESASPAGVALAWNAATDDVAVYGYEVLRGAAGSQPQTRLALVTGTTYTDATVEAGSSYAYAVRAVDTSFNRSASSATVTAKAELRTVTLTFDVTVPATTDATGREVHIAGFLDRLDGGLPQWNPGGAKLTRVSPTLWRITFTGKETTQIEYKYALGSWDYVEKTGDCQEVNNRPLTLSYGANGTQTVSDTVENWRNVAPCGN